MDNRIKEITINGLFGYYNVTVSLEDKANILVGANGIGKTTILNICYYLLKKEFTELKKYDFESIEVESMSGERERVIKPDFLTLALLEETVSSKSHTDILKMNQYIDELIKKNYDIKMKNFDIYHLLPEDYEHEYSRKTYKTSESRWIKKIKKRKVSALDKEEKSAVKFLKLLDNFEFKDILYLPI
ncbi:AAA family ATPase [Vagococcus carniphilus]|uniref:AAA family ATPase n=1 Tax=Vagococcus carniphilus TaxID=218144 RepID=UPI003B5A3BA3